MTHDYTRKGGIVNAESMLPAYAPPEFADRSTLWNSVEQIEKASWLSRAFSICSTLCQRIERSANSGGA